MFILTIFCGTDLRISKPLNPRHYITIHSFSGTAVHETWHGTSVGGGSLISGDVEESKASRCCWIKRGSRVQTMAHIEFKAYIEAMEVFLVELLKSLPTEVRHVLGVSWCHCAVFCLLNC